MDISKMYCRVDSEHFDEFVKLVGEQFGEEASRDVTNMCNYDGCVVVAVDVWSDEFEWCKKRGYTEFTGSWSIYNNTKPLSELTDEQAAELFNWWRNGGGILMKRETSDTEWFELQMVSFDGKGIIYRAKPKSERELFVEAADYFIDCGDDASVIAGKMFDAGFKAPKGGE